MAYSTPREIEPTSVMPSASTFEALETVLAFTARARNAFLAEPATPVL